MPSRASHRRAQVVSRRGVSAVGGGWVGAVAALACLVAVTWAAEPRATDPAPPTPWAPDPSPTLATGDSAGDDAPAVAPASTDATVRYGRDVRPLLSDRCFQCHGADASSREADLRLDGFEHAIADLGGYAALVPGDVEASELWRRVTSDDPEEVMPPPGAKKRPLTDADVDTLRRWIEQGATYEPHWAFVAPKRRPPAPEVRDPSWARDPLDEFVLARMEAAGVAPSPPADAATLARRVFLDLTGLPPTVEELDDFLAECAAVADVDVDAAEVPVDDGAYRALVNRLLTREPYRSRVAEHLTTPWLDAARYADTIGIHTDNGRQMWLWRDWVLQAFRDDMPWDRFVTEQLAGDLLPDATDAQKVATGFLRSHVITDEGGAIDEEYLVEYAVDRVNTTSAVLLGLTTGCARCHDHKYDPVTQEDFYSLLAFFDDNAEPGLYSQTPEVQQRAYEPFLAVPTDEQRARLDALDETLADLETQLAAPIPGEEEQRKVFVWSVAMSAGLHWTTPAFSHAKSTDEDVTFTLQDDGALLVGGPHPMTETWTVVLATEETGLRALLLEALSVPGQEGAGRASHGNAVVTSITLEQRSAEPGSAWCDVPLSWAWTDHLQTNYDHDPVNALDGRDDLGWALDGNERQGPRDLVLLTDEPFGVDGGTVLRIRVAFRSRYVQHSLGHVRFRVSPVTDTSAFPIAQGRWWRVGPFAPPEGAERAWAYDEVFGPEDGGPEASGRLPAPAVALDRDATFGEAARRWSFDGALVDGAVSPLGDTVGATFVGRPVWSPDAREVEVALGSDDGVQVFHDGVLVFEKRVDRGAAPDQDRVTLALHPGLNTLVLKVVNTGGPTAFAWEALQDEDVLVGELASALLPPDAVTPEQQDDFRVAWRRERFEAWRALDDERTATLAERAAVEDEVPRTMVMRERDEPREAFVLMRGQYDHPDATRPVEPRTPAFLAPLPDDAPRDRRGLARWMISPDNPLFARVSVNRFWEHVFGAGLVRTSQDFGLQGAWPTHPALLDRLALDFRASGWSVHALLRRLVTSATYRQASAARDDLAERDPEDRLLARYPRRRLSAEQIRDLALASSGLLVERLGGPPVKPYQPAGLWKEVAMLQSNTREFERGAGDDLWRRSLYTYWKRAVPPPALLTFDAPTRESCVVSRATTNTPLQALVLWNDDQFVEAARVLAARALEEASGDGAVDDDAPDDDAAGGDPRAREPDARDAARIVRIVRTCTARRPDTDELALLAGALDDWRARFADDPAAADALLAVGDAPRGTDAPPSEHAAWTLLAHTVLNLHETITQD